MSVGDFPTRGRKFCPRCDAVVLTVRQLEVHIAECPERTVMATRQRSASGRARDDAEGKQ
jgi:hypothetical protein